MFSFDYSDISFAHKEGFASSPRDEFDKHMHHFYEVIYLECGEVEFHVESIHRKLGEGYIVLVQPGQFHFADVNRDIRYRRYVCKMPEEALPNHLCEKLSRLPPFFEDCESLLPLFQDLDSFEEEFRNQPDDLRVLCLSKIVEILIRLSGRDYSPLDAPKDSFARDLVSYIEDHLRDPLTLEAIAKAFNYSTSYIATSFRKEMHVSIISYVRGKKVMAAHSLISHGVKPSEAALAMGFADYSTFFRCYQRLMGTSPSSAKRSK